jgi:hypothetical protein
VTVAIPASPSKSCRRSWGNLDLAMRIVPLAWPLATRARRQPVVATQELPS